MVNEQNLDVISVCSLLYGRLQTLTAGWPAVPFGSGRFLLCLTMRRDLKSPFNYVIKML